MSDTTSLGTPLQTARKISPLRQRMIDDMTVRNERTWIMHRY
jgi:hypothetical protein